MALYNGRQVIFFAAVKGSRMRVSRLPLRTHPPPFPRKGRESRRAISAEANSKFNAGRLTCNWSETTPLPKCCRTVDGRLFTTVKTWRMRVSRLPLRTHPPPTLKSVASYSLEKEELATPLRRGSPDARFLPRLAANLTLAG